MLTLLLTIYAIGSFLNLLLLGCFTASYALKNQADLTTGMFLFTLDAAKQLALALIWPLTLSYLASYWLLSKYIAHIVNRELKRQATIQEQCPIDNTSEDDIVELDINPVDSNLN